MSADAPPPSPRAALNANPHAVPQADVVPCSDPSLTVDLLVVGAGPAGLFAAFSAGFRGLSVAIMDSLPELGGQVAALYPEKPILDIAGLPAVLGRELIAGLTTQAMTSRPDLLLGHTAQTLTYTHGLPRSPPTATPSSGRRRRHHRRDRRVHPSPARRWGGLPGPRTVLLRHRPGRPDDQDVSVVGGGDSAFDWALAAAGGPARSPWPTAATPSGRTPPPSAASWKPHRSGSAEVPGGVTARRRRGDLAAVEVRDPRGTERLPVSRLVAALGFTASLGPLQAGA